MRSRSITLKERCNESEWAMSADDLSADAKSCFNDIETTLEGNHKIAITTNEEHWKTFYFFLPFYTRRAVVESHRERQGDLLHYKWLFALYGGAEKNFSGVFVRNIYISFLFAPSDCFKFFPRHFKRKVSLTTHYYGEFRSVEMSRCLESRGQLNATWKSYLLARKCFFFLSYFFRS